jgi:hypothetical protein
MPLIESIATFVGQTFFSFFINKGLGKLSISKETFEERVRGVYFETIKSYEQIYPRPNNEEKYPFYDSKEIVLALLKYRFSPKGNQLNISDVEKELEENQHIKHPSESELNVFFGIFEERFKSDDELKKLEIEKFYKERIFDIHEKVSQQNELLEKHIENTISLLGEEYKATLKDCFDEIMNLKPKSALGRLLKIEKRLNPQHSFNQIKAELHYLKAVCNGLLYNLDESYKLYIRAYTTHPEHEKYRNKALISFYRIDDKEYEQVADLIAEEDNYNPYVWAINAVQSNNIEEHVQNSTRLVTSQIEYQRIIIHEALNKRKESVLFLIGYFKLTDISIEIPTEVNYSNIDYFTLRCNAFLVENSNKNPTLYNRFTEKDSYGEYYLLLQKKLYQLVEKGNLGSHLNSIVFFYHYLEAEIHQDKKHATKMSIAYKSLNNVSKNSYNVTLLANTLQKHGLVDLAHELLKKYEGKEEPELISFKSYFYFIHFPAKFSLEKYYNNILIVDESNVTEICEYTLGMISRGLISRGLISVEEVRNLVNTLNFTNQNYKKLIGLLIAVFTDKNTVELSEIKQIEQEIKDKNIACYIATLYNMNEHYQESVNILNGTFDKEIPSKELLLYIETLYISKSINQEELLELLEHWRNNFRFNKQFLFMEIELRQLLGDWEQILDICTYGLSKKPTNEKLYTMFIISLSKLGEIAQLIEEIKQFPNIVFVNKKYKLNIVQALIDSKLYKESIIILYTEALDKENELARNWYFSLMMIKDFPKDIFGQYDIVEDGCTVRYDFDGESKTTRVDASSNNSLVREMIGKKVGDYISTSSGFSQKSKAVKITRIMNKYMALLDELQEEIKTPFTSIPVKSHHFDTTNLESMDASFIDIFGESQIQEKEQKDENFRDYYKHQVSLYQIVEWNFGGSFFDAYQYLTSNNSNGFLINPRKYIDIDLSIKSWKLVLDFTSSLLLYEMSKKINIRPTSFVIAQSLIDLLEGQVHKTDTEASPKVSITIKENKVLRTVYPENFAENRLSYLNDFKKWLNENAEIDATIEKLGLMRGVNDKVRMRKSMEFIVDTTLLAQRENYLLVTDDSSYSKMYGMNKAISTEFYLLNEFSEKQEEITQYLIEKNYLGLTLNDKDLYLSYFNQNKPNCSQVYLKSLENFILPYNFSEKTIKTAVLFMKEIAMTGSISDEKYVFDVSNLFVRLIRAFPNKNYGNLLLDEINHHFNLLGNKLFLTTDALARALSIMRNSN